MSITIKPQDVGRKVRLRNGTTGTIVGYKKKMPESSFSVIIRHDDDGDDFDHLTDGFFIEAGEDCPWDVVAWADEPTKQATRVIEAPNIADYPWPPVSHPDQKEGQTQCGQILAHMRMFGSITPQEALDEYGCFRLAARISDLRKRGHAIETETIRNGRKSWASYRLEGA